MGFKRLTPENWLEPDSVMRAFVHGAMSGKPYVPTLEGWLFLGVVVDMYSRKIVGWSMRDDLKDLVVDALAMAVTRRRPPVGLVHHSDRRSQGGFNRWSQHRSLAAMLAGH